MITPSTPSPDAPAAIAVDYGKLGNGRAWYDEEPPHLKDLTLALDSDRNEPVVNVTFGAQLRPATSDQSGGGTITFAASGDYSTKSDRRCWLR